VFNIHYPGQKRPSCCGVEGIQDARGVAKALGIPHHVLDFEADLKTLVVDNFIDEYLNGRTPNPCVRCNQFLKFDKLLKVAFESGADYLATGHYARLELPQGQTAYQLKKALDASKIRPIFFTAC